MTEQLTRDDQAVSSTAVDAFLAAVTGATIPECQAWHEDAVLSATVPNWRFHRYGAGAIRDEYAGWFADRGRFEHLRRTRASPGRAGCHAQQERPEASRRGARRLRLGQDDACP